MHQHGCQIFYGDICNPEKLDKLLALNDTRETPNGATDVSKSKLRRYNCKQTGHIQRNSPQKENESTAGTVSKR